MLTTEIGTHHKWFGVRPEVTDELRALLRKDVGGP
jgi:hypothetical protein